MNGRTPLARGLALCASLIGLTLFSGCGEKRPSESGSSRRVGQVEKAFNNAAKVSGVPVRYLMAAAYVESRLGPERAFANYATTDEEEALQRGTIMTETAFGLPMETLGLDPDKAESHVLEVQVDAYARWLQPQFNGLGLRDATTEDKYYWIWNLAQLHREGVETSRNVQILFAREMVQCLNEGFLWQDPRNGELLELPPEKHPIHIEEFPANGQEWFRLFEIDGEIFSASHLPLSTSPSGEFENTPRRIEVTHCPLSLSACLELMSSSKDREVYLEAHYLIPPDREIFSKVVQTVKHSGAIRYTNAAGEPKHVKDAVRIMLVGNSGRNIGGARRPALPNWFSHYQLQTMGQVILEVCNELAKKYPKKVNAAVCASTDKQNGVQFQFQQGEEFRWGDIADYDPTIFQSYVQNPFGLETGVAFQFGKGKRRFKAGANVPVTVMINPRVRRVELEKLERCSDGRVVWVPIETEQVLNETKITFSKRIFDPGPNRNGDQFFRARVSGPTGELMGWAIDQFHVHGFVQEDSYAPAKYCQID